MPGELSDAVLGDNDLPSVPTATRRFTWRELSALNRRSNAHVAYKGKVYDVSEFVHKHPGGIDQIMLGAGRDITQLFQCYHKLETAKILDKYCVGELIDNEMPVFPEISQFYVTLKSRVERYFKDNNMDPKVDYRMFAYYFIFISLTYAFWYLVLCYHSSWLLGVTFSLAWGFSTSLMTMTAGHDLSHFAITHKPWMWSLVAVPTQCFIFSHHIWNHQHTLGHHIYTNIDGADPDIGASNDEDFSRLKWTQKWLPQHVYQHIYLPLVYGIFGIRKWILDFPAMFGWYKISDTTRVNPPSTAQWINFVYSKVAYVTLRGIIPYYCMPLSSVIFYNFVAEIAFAYWLAIITQSTHISSEVEWPKPDKNQVFHMDWAELQVSSTMDFATDSWFWSVFTGHLNHQTAHHLFPGVCQSYYSIITPIVKKTCTEFGIKYRCVDSAYDIVKHHIKHLRLLGHDKTIKTE